MKLRNKFLCLGILSGSFFLIATQSCTKSKGELGTAATASFTVTPVAGNANTYALSSTSQNAFRYQWDRGDGTATAGGDKDTVYFFKKGAYKVKLYAYGRGGLGVDSQTINVTADDASVFPLNDATFQLLVSKTWKFDPGPSAKAVIVGTESNPAAYYGGGPLDASQLDDTYSFAPVSRVKFNLSYDAKGATFNGGNIQPNYVPGNDRSYVTTFTFSTVVDGAGIATITLPAGNPPSFFIGTTDIPSNNYRIISLNSTSLVLRAGVKSGTVFQFKFVAQ